MIVLVRHIHVWRYLLQRSLHVVCTEPQGGSIPLKFKRSFIDQCMYVQLYLLFCFYDVIKRDISHTCGMTTKSVTTRTIGE